MERIRVLLADMPSMLREVFNQVVASQPDMLVVGELTEPMELLIATGETQADVVILGLQDAALPGICSHLLNEYPHLKILGVSPDGHEAFLYELRAQKVPVGEVSVEGLLAAIRAVVRAGVV